MLVLPSVSPAQTPPCECDFQQAPPAQRNLGFYTPFGFFPKPPYKVWGNARAESVPAEHRVGIVKNCQAYEEYYGVPAPLTRRQVQNLRNETWSLHRQFREARNSIRQSYRLDEPPAMVGMRVAPSDESAPYAHTGPRAYAETPDYHGPTYTQSFQVNAPNNFLRNATVRTRNLSGDTHRDVTHTADFRVGASASPQF